MSHSGLSQERAFEKVFTTIQQGLCQASVYNPKLHEVHIRLEDNGYFLVKLFDKHWLREYKVASWQLEPLPGCCGVVISTNAIIESKYRRKGLGLFFNSIRKTLATLMDYGQIICTVNDTNIYEIKILKKNGWKLISSFTNPKTTHSISIYAA